jgi:hypothetical protein
VQTIPIGVACWLTTSSSARPLSSHRRRLLDVCILYSSLEVTRADAVGFIARPDGSVDWLDRPRSKGNYGMGALLLHHLPDS